MESSIQEPIRQFQVALAPGFVWDAQDAYLFDIDGTLLRSHDRIHVDSFSASVRRITGFEVTLAGIALQGNTDTAILREAGRQAGIPPRSWRRRPARSWKPCAPPWPNNAMPWT